MSEINIIKMYKKQCLDDPDTLFDLAMEVVISEAEAMVGRGFVGKFRRMQDVSLPIEVWERFLDAYQKKFRVNDGVAYMLSDTKSRLRSIKLRQADITDEGLSKLLEMKPRELDLTDCQLLTPTALQLINNYSDNLQSLSLVHTNVIINREPKKYSYTIASKCLNRLTINHHELNMIFPPTLYSPDQLTYLDLSECHVIVGLGISKFRNLETLILHAVPGIEDMILWISGTGTLRHLDVSQKSERFARFNNPNAVLANLVLSLPLLTRLDISGTNLAGTGAADIGGLPKAKCDIPGLMSRVDRPLAFLGLYGTRNAACKRHDIPALSISGDANEEQVLTACAAYMERPEVLARVLNDLYYMFRYESNRQVQRALHLVLDAMERYVHEKTVQVSGSASLFYIVKEKEVDSISVKTKQRIITSLLAGMEAHIEDETMLRNGCLGLTRFKIPHDVLFQYERLSTVLINGVLNSRMEDFVRRMGIFLLNSLACQVDTQHKQFLGKCGAIGTMLDIICDRVDHHICDAMLEMAWSILWNMTDEMPENCELFLKLKGLKLFLSCLQAFPEKDDQLRNMMGLLGNVAENPPLRRQIGTQELLKVFYDLLVSTDGIEVSYNAGGVLAHILSDGEEAWTVENPERAKVLARLQSAIQSWDVKAERNINYRSFKPILSLLRAHHTPQCQHWAAWALANLTTVYPDKYCKLIRDEGGLELLQSVCGHQTPYKQVKELCNIVIKNVTKSADMET